MPQGGYAYAPAGVGISFRNGTDKPLRFLLYKQRYIPHPDPAMQPYAVFGNTNDIEERIYDNMENVFVRDLLPVDERFDMNMHILSFAPGGCHPFVETHVQEHGAYLYEGEGLYLLNDDWVPVCSILRRFSGSCMAAALAMSTVFVTSTSSMTRRSWARMVVSVSVTSTMASARPSTTLASVAPHE